VRNDQTLKVTRDRTVNSGRDDNLYVERDRKITVKGKQENKTTGNHISLVEGRHSLEVKGDLARKVTGALGIQVDGDIVLESKSKITLKVGSSFVVIHPSGVDITGLKINLNGGGSPGTPVKIAGDGSLPGELLTQYFDRKLRFSSDITYRVETTEGEEILSGSGVSGYIGKKDSQSEYWVFVS